MKPNLAQIGTREMLHDAFREACPAPPSMALPPDPNTELLLHDFIVGAAAGPANGEDYARDAAKESSAFAPLYRMIENGRDANGRFISNARWFSDKCPHCLSTMRNVRGIVPVFGHRCDNDWHEPLCTCGRMKYDHGKGWEACKGYVEDHSAHNDERRLGDLERRANQ